jgi:hypothetical protein
MGVLVHNVAHESGHVFQSAYISFATNGMYVQPQPQLGSFLVHATYNVWNSFVDRMSGRVPLATMSIIVNAPSLEDMYASLYEAIKNKYPDHQDYQPDNATAENTPDPTPEPEPVPTPDPVPDNVPEPAAIVL